MAASWLTQAILLLSIGLGAGVNVAFAKQQEPRAPGALAAEVAPAAEEQGLAARKYARGPRIRLSTLPPAGTGLAVDDAFISYAFEFWLYPPFAGNISHPNIFSNNLLNNIGALQGVKPRVRVGGNSADFALYNKSQVFPVITRPVDTGYSIGIKTVQYYGDAFFESFQTFPDVKFIYNFDMGWIVANPAGPTVGLTSLNATVPLICKALGTSGLLYWEYGNEPNLYDDYSHNYTTDATWTNQIYVNAWKQGTAVIRDRMKNSPECAGVASDAFTAPGVWPPSPNDTVTLDGSWNAGLKQTGLVKELSAHRYLQNSKGNITLENTLLNHTHAITSLATTLAPYAKIAASAPRLFLGESASLSPIGIYGVTNTLAAALWNMDWALHTASQNISRVHFQQGVGFFYNSWEVANTGVTGVTPGTKAPYYGNLAAAYAIGPAGTRVYEHNLNGSPVDVAYSIYVNGMLKRIAVLNLRSYYSGTRGSQTYTFDVPWYYRGGTIKRLVGPSSDNQGGVQWDGNMYGLDPNKGLATPTGNVTTGETFSVRFGQASVKLDDSSAVVLQFS